MKAAIRIRHAVLAGVAVLTAGRIVDLWWHSTHGEFEQGIEQLQAHWVAWLGAAVMLTASIVAVRRSDSRTPGFLVVLASGSLYALVAIWHFRLHEMGQDPDLPHLLLALSQGGLYLGGVIVAAGLVIPSCREKYIVTRVQPLS